MLRVSSEWFERHDALQLLKLHLEHQKLPRALNLIKIEDYEATINLSASASNRGHFPLTVEVALMIGQQRHLVNALAAECIIGVSCAIAILLLLFSLALPYR